MIRNMIIEQNVPNPLKRFGHSITMINKNVAVIFGGAVGDGVYKITNETFSFDSRSNKWTQIIPKKTDDCPSPRAAHAATVV